MGAETVALLAHIRAICMSCIMGVAAPTHVVKVATGVDVQESVICTVHVQQKEVRIKRAPERLEGLLRSDCGSCSNVREPCMRTRWVVWG